MATNYIKIEWGNSCNLGNIYYGGGFINKLFLDAEIGKPEYIVEEEGFDNGQAVKKKTFEKFQKKYVLQVVVPEYVADALQLMPLHDNIRISYTNGLYSGQVRNLEVTVSYLEETSDCMAIVEIKFQQDDQAVKDNCCT